MWRDVDCYFSRRGSYNRGCRWRSHSRWRSHTGKSLGNGLKNAVVKIGSMLPGLIGSIVSFLVKTAGQVASYLAEHTCRLLILAAVFFLFDNYINKRR